MKQALQQSANLLSAVDHAQRAGKIKSDVLAMLAHHLSTPLQVIKGHAALLQANAADPNESWPAIERAGDVMQQLVQNAIDLSCIEAGRLPVARVPFQVAEVVCRAHGAVSPAARAKGLAVRIEAAQPDRVMWSDPNRLEQILTNLLSNAVQYTSEGWIEIACPKSNGSINITIADTGPGMTAQEIESAIEPFRSGAAGRGRADSHGLGLAICRKLIERLGGTLEVGSEPGKGTRFCVRLTIELSQADADAGST